MYRKTSSKRLRRLFAHINISNPQIKQHSYKTGV